MSQQSFIWRGTAQAVTLHDAAGEVVWEGNLFPGVPGAGLPLDHPIVAGWIAQQMLTAGDARPSNETETAGETGQRRKRGQQES